MKTLLLTTVLLVSGFELASAEDDIPMGSLGFPLGKYLIIEGVRAEGFKAGSQSLLVDTIDGKKLDKPIGIWIDNVGSLPSGQRCVLRGFESGRMIGVPREVLKKEGLGQPQAVWQFYKYFIVTSVVEPKNLEVDPFGKKEKS